jgi:hypothetical protein
MTKEEALGYIKQGKTLATRGQGTNDFFLSYCNESIMCYAYGRVFVCNNIDETYKYMFIVKDDEGIIDEIFEVINKQGGVLKEYYSKEVDDSIMRMKETHKLTCKIPEGRYCQDCRFKHTDSILLDIECILHDKRLILETVFKKEKYRKCQDCLDQKKVEITYEVSE